MEPPRKRNRPESFKIEFPGDVNFRRFVSDGMQKVRQHLLTSWNRPVSNSDILKHLLSLHNDPKDDDTENRYDFNTYQQANRQDVDQTMFVTMDTSLQKCLDISAYHARLCPAELKVQKITRRGHVGIAKLCCNQPQGNHAYIWSSSPYLPNKELLANARILHAYSTSGMIRAQYLRFCQAAGIGLLRDIRDGERQKPSFQHYYGAVTDAYTESTEQAILEEA